MPQYLAEWYAPSFDASGTGSAELRRSARRAARNGSRVWLLRSVFLRQDELVLCLLEGPDEEAVRSVLEMAGVQVDRIVEAEAVSRPRSRPDGGGADSEGERSRHHVDATRRSP